MFVSHDQVLRQAQSLEMRLSQRSRLPDCDTVLGITRSLSQWREYESVQAIAESFAAHYDECSELTYLHACALLECRRPGLARMVLESALFRMDKGSPYWENLLGLLGRAYQELYSLNMQMGKSDAAIAAAHRAMQVFEQGFRHDPRVNVHHGTRLCAMTFVAEKLGFVPAGAKSARDIAQEVLAHLGPSRRGKEDVIFEVHRAQCYIALGQWEEAEEAIGRHLADPRSGRRSLRELMRQLRDVWHIQSDGPHGIGLLQILEACFARHRWDTEVDPYSCIWVETSHTARLHSLTAAPLPAVDQVARVLGAEGEATLDWHRLGMRRVASSASISTQDGFRVASGFLVDPKSVGLEGCDRTKRYLLTSRARLNAVDGLANLRVRFEASSKQYCTLEYRIEAMLVNPAFGATSQLCLLVLKGDLHGITPLNMVDYIPPQDSAPHVFLFGYPSGRSSSVLFQDMPMTMTRDGEGPPQMSYPCYAEPGIIGGPIFDAGWRCVGVHSFDPRQCTRRPGMEMNWKDKYCDGKGIWHSAIRRMEPRVLAYSRPSP